MHKFKKEPDDNIYDIVIQMSLKETNEAIEWIDSKGYSLEGAIEDIKKDRVMLEGLGRLRGRDNAYIECDTIEEFIECSKKLLPLYFTINRDLRTTEWFVACWKKGLCWYSLDRGYATNKTDRYEILINYKDVREGSDINLLIAINAIRREIKKC